MRALYAGCYRRLVAQVFALTADLTEAQDAVEEAFARALAAPRSFGRVDDPEAWLRTTALGLARRRTRRHLVAGRLRRQAAGEPGDTARGNTALDASHAGLLTALARLPERDREVVALHHLAGLTMHEIANLVGISDASVYARLEQGATALSSLLGTVSDA